MSQLSTIDLQNLRHLIESCETTQCKMAEFSLQAKDPEIKKIFQDAADSALEYKRDLLSFL